VLILNKGDLFAGCRIIDVCGNGGFGMVYLAEDAVGRRAAVEAPRRVRQRSRHGSSAIRCGVPACCGVLSGLRGVECLPETALTSLRRKLDADERKHKQIRKRYPCPGRDCHSGPSLRVLRSAGGWRWGDGTPLAVSLPPPRGCFRSPK